MPKYMEEEMKEGGNQNLKKRLRISPSALREVNQFCLDPNNPVINGLLRVLEKYGAPEEINAKARKAQKLSNLLKRLQVMKSPYLKDLEWLMAEQEKGSFISISEFRRKVLGKQVDGMTFDEAHAVTLEISAFQYFPWLLPAAP